MQSDGEETLLHSCFGSLKSAVMGCCYSICHKETDPEENVVNERTHLLEVAEQQQETPSPTACAATPPRKADEQSALSRILHETATNVIDVGALGPYALEASAYNERVRAYTARAALAQPPPPAPPRLLTDLPPAVRTVVLCSGPPASGDRELVYNALATPLMLRVSMGDGITYDQANHLLVCLPFHIKKITNAVKKAAAAISELRVKHHEDLVVPFRVP